MQNHLVKTFRCIVLSVFISQNNFSQTFTRSELSTTLTTPWEMTYGPDNYLWLTEAGGKISRVNPETGQKETIYTATDYFGGSYLERFPDCHKPAIGAGTLGMALHPDFLGVTTSYIYFVHSYNEGDQLNPLTRFKIRRLRWDATKAMVTADTTLIKNIPSGYDHLGGRLIIATQNNTYYLFLSVGDLGLSETNSPDCYSNPFNNPNNNAQDPDYKNGKIHRFNLDGSIPVTNPLPRNSMFTRGHRNPQGLIYNNFAGVVYDVEHGDRTDDEINVLLPGRNYGWKNVRGYLNDNNFAGEQAHVAAYTPNLNIANDELKGPLYSWCATPQPTISNYLDWCTVAPSDGIYYSSTAISDWTNSLLVVTLKNGISTDMEVYCFKLNANGLGLLPATTTNPNPTRFFGEDQLLNGRLRDIAISPDGKKIYLVNNGGAPRDKITVYTYAPKATITERETDFDVRFYPNPFQSELTVKCSELVRKYGVYNCVGEQLLENEGVNASEFKLYFTQVGYLFVKIHTVSGKVITKKIVATQ